jgi:hypothetical protein
MEAFETFVALALETEGLVVSEAVKFDIARQTTSGYQTHGYEVDLLGARRDRLVLASVKSFFGSNGVNADQVAGTSKNATRNKRYALINDPVIRDRVVEMAAQRYGYEIEQLEVRLYVGKSSGRPGTHDARVKEWCAAQRAGGGPIKVVEVDEVVDRVREVASKKQYRDNAALVALKVLDAAGVLKPDRNDVG